MKIGFGQEDDVLGLFSRGLGRSRLFQGFGRNSSYHNCPKIVLSPSGLAALKKRGCDFQALHAVSGEIQGKRSNFDLDRCPAT
jgi:hypothetical protein